MPRLSFLLVRIFALLVALIAAQTPLFQQNVAQLEKDKAWQVRHVAALEQKLGERDRAWSDDSRWFDGELSDALAQGMKFNELRCIATHNSYQNESVPELKWWYGLVSKLTFGAVPANGGDFQSASLARQLSSGIRSLELDVEVMREKGGLSFVCLHSPVLDMTTHSYDFALALREIKLWSDAHPAHLPITLIVEPKVAMLPLENMDAFTLENAKTLDKLLREALGDSLLTPKDMLRGYDSFSAMRAADDWCRVDAMQGKVLVLLHDTLITKLYIGQDQSLRTQAMFPMVRPADAGKPYAAFLIVNDPEKAETQTAELIGEGKFIVRTRSDSFGKPEEEKRLAALQSGAQILSTDYPPMPGETLPFAFGNGKTLQWAK